MKAHNWVYSRLIFVVLIKYMYILFDKRTDLGRSLSSLGLFDLNIIAGFEKNQICGKTLSKHK